MVTEIQVYCVNIEELKGLVPSFLQSLSADERKKADRYHYERHRNGYIIRRGVLRSLLGRILEVEPGQVRFTYGRWGKPALDPAYHPGRDLHFNLAHSRDIALLAFSRRQNIGVDVEYLRRLPDADQIATRFFSTLEQQALLALPPEQKTTGFHNCWTRKEAYIKALGTGLTMPLHTFAVSLTPGEPAALLHVDRRLGEAERWSIHSWEPYPGYLAALALEGESIRLDRRRLPADLLR